MSEENDGYIKRNDVLYFELPNIVDESLEKFQLSMGRKLKNLRV